MSPAPNAQHENILNELRAIEQLINSYILALNMFKIFKILALLLIEIFLTSLTT